eukprot:8654414-Pyramimonas_sp.AAC.1
MDPLPGNSTIGARSHHHYRCHHAACVPKPERPPTPEEPRSGLALRSPPPGSAPAGLVPAALAAQ